MKTTLIILSCLLFAFVVYFFILGIMSKQGKAPGLIDGDLTNCSDKPNCVCSGQKEGDSHYIAPIVLVHNSPSDALVVLKEIVGKMGGTIQSEKENYLAATFSSTLFGFVDDLEIKIDREHQLIHIRSSSRVGHNDMGINKKRVTLLKELYQQKIL